MYERGREKREEERERDETSRDVYERGREKREEEREGDETSRDVYVLSGWPHESAWRSRVFLSKA